MGIYAISIVVGIVLLMVGSFIPMFVPALSAVAPWLFLAGGLILIVPAGIGLLFSKSSHLR
jgi:hypothetical protein